MSQPRTLFVAACVVAAVGCHDELYHDLDEQTANELVVALHEAGIDAEKTAEDRRGYTVEVPRGATTRAMAALQARGLPRPAVEGFSTAFPGDGLVPSPAEDRARLQYATAQEARRSLLSIDGVLDAHVNLVLPDTRRKTDSAPAKASVVIKWTGSEAPVDERDVKRVVAGGVEGLSVDDVEVLMARAQPRPQPSSLELVTVGPLTVHAAAKSTAQLTLAAFTSAILMLGALLVAVVHRNRATRR